MMENINIVDKLYVKFGFIRKTMDKLYYLFGFTNVRSFWFWIKFLMLSGLVVAFIILLFMALIKFVR